VFAVKASLLRTLEERQANDPQRPAGDVTELVCVLPRYMIAAKPAQALCAQESR
jgi:hypothetical protein